MSRSSPGSDSSLSGILHLDDIDVLTMRPELGKNSSTIPEYVALLSADVSSVSINHIKNVYITTVTIRWLPKFDARQNNNSDSDIDLFPKN